MENLESKATGKFAATLSLLEIGLGSVLHSFKIPLSGHILSISQMAILSRASFELKSAKASLEISIIASLLKSLSPAGKKLTPMLAIAAQGLFYFLGIFLGGLNYAGLILAILLSSAWAFIQPVLFILILFGKTSMEVAHYYLKEMNTVFPGADHFIIKLVFILYLIKSTLAYLLSLAFIKMDEKTFNSYLSRFSGKNKILKVSNQPHWKQALKDLFQPIFIVSFLFTALFFYFSHSEKSTVIWGLIRPIAIGYLAFFILRVWPVEKVPTYLKKRGFLSLANNLEVAISSIKKKSDSK